MDKIKNAIRITAAILYFAVAVFAVIQAALPAEQSSEVSASFAIFTGLFGEGVTEIQVLDKTVTFEDFASFLRKLVGHFGLFGFLGFLGFIAASGFKDNSKWLIIDLLTTFFFAALTETIQLVTPGRGGLFSDVVLDMQGAVMSVCALAAIQSVYFYFKRVSMKKSAYIAALFYVAFIALYFGFNSGSLNTTICFYIYLITGGISSLLSLIFSHLRKI